MTLNRNLLLPVLAALIYVSSCKKEEPKPAPPAQESGQSSTDNREALSETDVAVSDINVVIMDDARFRGRVSGSSGASSATICGMSVDTAGASQGSLTLNFDGTSCNNRTRTGQIKLAIKDYDTGIRWRDAGCVLLVEFVNYKVMRTSDKKFITLNGLANVTNETGGGWWELLFVKTQPSIVTSIQGSNIKATFDDNKTATYNIHRRVTYSIPNNVLTCTAEGLGTSGNLQNVENHGTTRLGEAFTSQVSTPIVWNLTCGAFAPIAGEVNVQVSGKSFALRCLFGTDASGNKMSVGSNDCPYGWKLQWSVNNQTQTRVVGYH